MQARREDLESIEGIVKALYEVISGPATASSASATSPTINSIQLFHDGDRWWVMSVLWDNEREGNPLPADLAGRDL
jgi:hypothetical protein